MSNNEKPHIVLHSFKDGVKPLDLSNILKHAFLAGVKSSRDTLNGNIPGSVLWLDYDPLEIGSYNRILSAIAEIRNLSDEKT